MRRISTSSEVSRQRNTNVRSLDCHDKHDPTSNRNQKERDNVEDSNNIQSDIAGAGQLGFGEHFVWDYWV